MTAPSLRSASWTWLLFLFALAGFVETMFFGQMTAFTPLHLPALGVPLADVTIWTGIIAVISNAVGIPLLPFWGTLADRYARKPIIVRSFAAHIVAAVLMLAAANVWVFTLGRSAMSLALGNTGLMMTTLSERTPQARIGLAFAIVNSAAPIGAFLGPLLGGRVVDRLGFGALLWINAGLMGVLILALTFGYREEYKGTDRGPLLQMAIDSLRLIWRSRRLRALFPALFVLFASWMLAITYVPLAVTALYRGDQPGTAVGIVLAAGGLVTLVLGPAVGALSDRFGHWPALFTSATLAAVLWPLPALARDLVFFTLAWAVLNGVLSGVFAVSFAVMAGSASDAVRGRVMSFAYLPLNVGSLIGPAIGSLITTRLTIFAVFPAAALITAAGIAMLAIAARQSTEIK